MRSYFVGRTPAETWLRTAHWYQAMRRFMSVAAIDDASMVERMNRLRDALEVNVLLMADIYSQVPTPRHKALANRLLDAWQETLEMSGEPYPESLGVVPEIMQIVRYGAPMVVSWCWRWGTRALAAWGLITVGPPLIKGIGRLASAISDLSKSEAETAKEAAEATIEAQKQKQQAIDKCKLDFAGNPQAIAECVKGLNETFASIIPSGECGLLDTPTGTALGGIMGLVGGYVAAEAVFGWVE